MYIEIVWLDYSFTHYTSAAATITDLTRRWAAVRSIAIVRPYSVKRFRNVSNYINYVMAQQEVAA